MVQVTHFGTIGTFGKTRRAASHRIWPARHGGDAGARHFDETDRAHEFDELVDLAGGAGKLEHKALDRRIDYSLAEGSASRKASSRSCPLPATLIIASSRSTALPRKVRSVTLWTGTSRWHGFSF